MGVGDGRGVDPMLECCRPLAVEVFRITNAGVLEEWELPKPSEYKELHGTSVPIFSERGPRCSLLCKQILRIKHKPPR